MAGPGTWTSDVRPLEPDPELLDACGRADEEAWARLLDKYKRLIYSIPSREGLAPEEAADIFQSVCLELVGALPSLREPGALPKWLIETTSHACWRHKRRQARSSIVPDDHATPPVEPVADRVLFELQKEQALRAAVWHLPPRCRAIVEMLFFETSPRPYRDVAESLGLAEASVGFIRGRCLNRLRSSLRSAGL